MTQQLRSRRKKTARQPIDVDVRLGDWAHKGSTAALLGDRRILVDRGIPGELVHVAVQRGRTPWRAVVQEVHEPAPHRVSPPCPYYLANCGGCQWQHMSYEAQLGVKRDLVNREMALQGVEARVDRVHPMHHPWRYRRTAAVAIGWEAGFRPRGRRGIVEIHDCLISHPLIGHLAHRLNEILEGGGLPNYHGKVWLDCTVVGSEDRLGLQVLLQGIRGLTLDEHPELPQVAATLAAIEHVWSVAYRHRTGEALPLIGDLMSTVEVGGRPMYLPAGSFFQTNLVMLDILQKRIAEEVAGRSIREAADVYGGVGTFALPLAASAERMTLLELDALAVAAAERTAEQWGIRNLRCLSGHAEQALKSLLPLDLVVVDPPRSGLGTAVTETLIESHCPLLIYVSCSPPSLAADVAALGAGGYRVRSLEVFDFYPQTYHVESLAILEL